MAAVQSVPDDEIAAELAGSWLPGDPDGPPPLGPARGPEAAGGAGEERAGRPRVVIRRRPVEGGGVRPDPDDLRRAAERVAPVTLAGERVLPLAPAFAGLLPAGLPRGTTVAVAGAAGPAGAAGVTGATALALALSASASAAGSWVAVVGLPALGLAAAAELGLALERLVVVVAPPVERWGTVVGSLVGAFDVVLLGAPVGSARVRPAELRRLAARARERGTVLMPLGGPTAAGTPVVDADLRVTVGPLGWEGLDVGHGLLRRRRVAVEVTGRRAAARARRAELWLPDEHGRVRTVEPDERRGGADAGDLASARRARARRVARRPLPRPVAGDGRAGVGGWSDAG